MTSLYDMFLSGITAPVSHMSQGIKIKYHWSVIQRWSKNKVSKKDIAWTLDKHEVSICDKTQIILGIPVCFFKLMRNLHEEVNGNGS